MCYHYLQYGLECDSSIAHAHDGRHPQWLELIMKHESFENFSSIIMLLQQAVGTSKCRM